MSSAVGPVIGAVVAVLAVVLGAALLRLVVRTARSDAAAPRISDRPNRVIAHQAKKPEMRWTRSPHQPPLLEPLPADALVNFAAERMTTGMDEVLVALDRELIGLEQVKKRIEEIASLLLVDRVRQRFGMRAPRLNLHMCFTGSPGTGKTTVGMRMAQLLHRLGYLEQGQLVAVMRDDLVGQYIGQTAPLTRKVLERAMGGVLFIDEAYHLFRPEDGKDFGQEAIEILLQVMENDRDKVVVILAGYKDRMETFFNSNPGMGSRVAHHLDFPDYNLDELGAIGDLMLNQASYYLSPEADSVLRRHLAHEMDAPYFANARSVRNLLERARLGHASRLLAQPERGWGRDDLMRIEAEDIPIDGQLSLSGVRDHTLSIR